MNFQVQCLTEVDMVDMVPLVMAASAAKRGELTTVFQEHGQILEGKCMPLQNLLELLSHPAPMNYMNKRTHQQVGSSEAMTFDA